ncbi:hypothetical protein [Campylobacter fetus]|uniref:hypothetical protein n=1 Tax=Campylobacter fetus TaxID=196 RepID=UPI00138DE3B3|nr:hypothetical protein [Campylobacter fetus]
MDYEKLSDNAAFNERTGNKLKRVNLEHLDRLEGLIKANSPFGASYDVNRTQGLDFCELSYTEIFKNAIYLTPQNTELAYKMAFLAKISYLGDLEKDKQNLLNKIAFKDKYKSAELCGNKISSVCFLSGSNALKRTISISELIKWVHYDENMLIKPHPLTDEKDLNELGVLLGKNRVLKPEISAFDLLKNANRIYSTSSSELGLYAALMGKEVVDITNFVNADETAYAPLYRFINYPYNKDLSALISVLSSHLSGVFFYDDENLEEKLKEYFKALNELKNINKPYSNAEFKKRLKEIK